MKYFFLFMLITSAFASVNDETLIQGTVGNVWDEEKVKVHDSLGQTYFLKKSVFPKDFKIQTGAFFSIQVKDKDLGPTKLLKK